MAAIVRHTTLIQPGYHTMYDKNIVPTYLIIAMLCTSGCMAGKTKSLPFTEYPPAGISETALKKQYTIIIEPFDISSTEIKGGHHEGLLQVRQPWIWGLSQEQKDALYGDVANVARYAFIDELLKRKQRIRIPGYSEPGKPSDFKITGTVRSVELNTYGQGTREGFGSAGNYWEATIELTRVTIVRSRDNKTLWNGDITQYCKLQDNPIKLDWTIFTVISKSLQQSLTMSMGSSPGRIQDVVENSAATYEVGPITKNPVEIASRLAALEVLKQIAELQK